MFKKLISLALAVAFAAAVVSAPIGSAVAHPTPKAERFVYASSWVADDNPILALKYIGDQAYASVDINGTGIEFFSGSTTGPTALTAGDEIDEDRGAVCDSGSTENSILDVAEADCDTYGELVSVINASTNWRAELVGALPGDTIAAADFIDPASANVRGLGTDFYGMVADDSGFDEIVLTLGPHSGRVNKDDPSPFLDNDFDERNVCGGKQVFLTNVDLTADVTGAVTLDVYSYDMVNNTTERIASRTASDDTLTNFNFQEVPLVSAPDECLMVRVSGGTLVTGSISANGFTAPEQE